MSIGPYDSSLAFRSALEDRLKAQALDVGIALDRLRRRVFVERLLARLTSAQPGRWVLKGGMALDLRLGPEARATKDIDLGLRLSPAEVDAAVDLIQAALATDLDDGFTFAISKVEQLGLDDAGDICRLSLVATVAGKPWSSVKVDIGIREHELTATEQIPLPGLLRFAGIEPTMVETISLPRHVAEKFHGMLKTFEDRENTRTRDLVDIVHLHRLGLIDEPAASDSLVEVFTERSTQIPERLPALPPSWAEPYERIAAEHHIEPTSFHEAVATAQALWARLTHQET